MAFLARSRIIWRANLPHKAWASAFHQDSFDRISRKFSRNKLQSIWNSDAEDETRGMKIISADGMVKALPLTAFATAMYWGLLGPELHAVQETVEAIDPIIANSDLGYAATRFLQITPPLCAQFLFGSAITAINQFRKEKTTGKLEGLAPVSMVVNCSIWSAYGFLAAQDTPAMCDWTITMPNVSGLGIGLVYTYFYHKYCPPGALTKYYAGGGLVLGGLLAASSAVDLMTLKTIVGNTGAAAAVVLMASPLATIKTVIEEKSTAALPLIPSIAVVCNASTWTSYGLFVVHDPVVWVPNALGLCAGVVQLGCFGIYGLPPPSASEQPVVETKSENEEVSK